MIAAFNHTTAIPPGRMAAASMLRCSMGSASSTCRQWKSHSKRLKRDALRQACNFSAARVDAAQHLACMHVYVRVDWLVRMDTHCNLTHPNPIAQVTSGCWSLRKTGP
eukprot:519461-Pelagomonas_calceolata.AAC.1